MAFAGAGITPETMIAAVAQSQRERNQPPDLGLGDAFFYPFNPPALAINATGVVASVNVDNDADFLWDRITSFSSCLFSVFIMNSSLGVPYMSSPAAPINGENLSGPASLPYWLPKPYRIRRGSILTATFNNRVAFVNTIQLVLVGYKVQ
jgi:hypothetical protein